MPTEAEILDAHNAAEIARSLYEAANAAYQEQIAKVELLQEQNVTLPDDLLDAYWAAHNACEQRKAEFDAAAARLELLNLAAQVGAA